MSQSQSLDVQVRVGIVGCGSIARHRHAPELARNPQARIVAFADRVPARAQECAAKYGGAGIPDWEDLVTRSDIDAVVVCTPNAFHAPITIAALKAGKHVLCEKPMATSDAEARAMIAAAQKAGKFLMIGHNQRLAPLHVKAKQLIDEASSARSSPSAPPSPTPARRAGASRAPTGWFFDKKQAFVGSMGDLGVHKADLLRWLLGEEIVEVAAMVGHLDKPMGDVDDNAVCLLRTASGAVGTLTASWTPQPRRGQRHDPLRQQRHPAPRLRPAASASWSNWRPARSSSTRSARSQTNEAGGQSNSGVIDAFVHSIQTNTPPDISGEKAAAPSPSSWPA